MLSLTRRWRNISFVRTLLILIVIILIGFFVHYVYFVPHQLSESTWTSVSFRMDDIQDFWQSKKQRAILSLHIERKIPIKIAIIAGLFGEDEELVELVERGMSLGLITTQNHGLTTERISNKPYEEQFGIIQEANKRIREILDVIPTEFVPAELSYDENTIRALEDLNMSLSVDEPHHIFVTLYSDDGWEPFNQSELLNNTSAALEKYGKAELYLHFQAITFEEYLALLNSIEKEFGSYAQSRSITSERLGA